MHTIAAIGLTCALSMGMPCATCPAAGAQSADAPTPMAVSCPSYMPQWLCDFFGWQ